MKKIILLCTLLLIPAALLYGEAEDGGYAGAFLQMAYPARPAGMGGAYLAVSDDIAGQVFNPAGTSGIPLKTFSSSYRIMTLDRKVGMVALIVPTKGESSLGVSWIYAGYGEVEGRNSSGQTTGEIISSSEHDFGLTFAKQFTPFLGAGTKLNYYYKRLADISANSIGIDAGILLSLDSLREYGSMEGKPITDIKVGLVFRHLTATYSWNSNSDMLAATQDDKFPYNLAGGVSFRTLQRKALVAVDLEKSFEQAVVLRLGGEYDLGNRLLLRAGLNDGHIAAGMSYGFLFGKNRLGFHYAFSAERTDEGSDHIISMDLQF